MKQQFTMDVYLFLKKNSNQFGFKETAGQFMKYVLALLGSLHLKQEMVFRKNKNLKLLFLIKDNIYEISRHMTVFDTGKVSGVFLPALSEYF